MRIVKATMLMVLTSILGCQDDVNREFSTISVAINDTNGIAIADSIYFIKPDSLPNKVSIISDVSNPDLNYSVNSSAYIRIPNESIILKKQDTVLQFHLTKAGFEDSDTKIIVFQSQTEKYLSKSTVSSINSGSNLNIALNDKSRGMLEVEIFNVTGQRLLHRNHVKNMDQYTIKYALADYPIGVYFVSVTYGKNKKGYRFIKE